MNADMMKKITFEGVGQPFEINLSSTPKLRFCC